MLRNRERADTEKTERAERKPAPQRDMVRKGTKSSNGLIRYFQETADELRKVSWPTREQAIRLSAIVLATTAVAAVFLGALDAVFRYLSSLLVNTG